MPSNTNRQRGTAYHEAGHAVLSWIFDLPVQAVRIQYDEAKHSWSGGTDLQGNDAHLSLEERIEILSAGHAAEKVFEHRAEEFASVEDLTQMINMLAANQIPEPLNEEIVRTGDQRARVRLREHEARVKRLADRLVQTGRVERGEFLQLMQSNPEK